MNCSATRPSPLNGSIRAPRVRDEDDVSILGRFAESLNEMLFVLADCVDRDLHMTVHVEPDGTVTVTPFAMTSGPNVPELLLEVPVRVVDAAVCDCVTV